jgi:MFS family permease
MHLRYFGLLRDNPRFRKIWLAQIISEMGDWFYSIAVYDLILQLTGSGRAVSYAIIIQLLPWFFMTPLAGYLADRFSRRQLMIVADVVRGFVVLGLVFVRSASDLWAIYLLLGIEVVFAAIFEPARNALIPNVTQKDELLPANALSSATWSVALTVGAGLGGAVTALFGRDVSFVINSLSFFLSAAFILRIALRETHVARGAADKSESSGLRALRQGAAYLRANPRVVALVLAKTGLGLAGGYLLILAVFGEQVFAIAGHGSLAMGLLYSARGAGAGTGPILGDLLTRGQESRMWKSLGASFILMALSYVAVAHAPNLPLAMLGVFFGHMGGSNIWVVSTTLLQMHTADRFRGRVFALDFGMNMLTASASNYAVGLGLDVFQFGARQLAQVLGLVLLLPGALWLRAVAKWGGAKPPLPKSAPEIRSRD